MGLPPVVNVLPQMTLTGCPTATEPGLNYSISITYAAQFTLTATPVNKLALTGGGYTNTLVSGSHVSGGS